MAAARHNLTRRALLGVGVGAWALGGGEAGASLAASARRARSGLAGDDPVRLRFGRALHALRRAEARLAAFKAAEARLPPERRAFPACKDLEERFGRLEDLRCAALRRLLAAPAPDIPALALMLELAVADRAWELAGAEDCLALIAADARRMAGPGPTDR